MKFLKLLKKTSIHLSHPVRGAWIEILKVTGIFRMSGLSHPVRGAWIEISGNTHYEYICEKSHPVRGAWIEIQRNGDISKATYSRIP